MQSHDAPDENSARPPRLILPTEWIKASGDAAMGVDAQQSSPSLRPEARRTMESLLASSRVLRIMSDRQRLRAAKARKGSNTLLDQGRKLRQRVPVLSASRVKQ